jgi:hypothetical protein
MFRNKKEETKNGRKKKEERIRAISSAVYCIDNEYKVAILVFQYVDSRTGTEFIKSVCIK